MRALLIALVAVLLVGSSATLGQIPRMISYQGVFADSLGNAKVDDNYRFAFRIFDGNGSKLWEETKQIRTRRGLFSTMLGDATPFGATMTFDKQYWLETQVGDEVISPRIALSSSSYSMNSERANYALASPADDLWSLHDGNVIFGQQGNIGIGTNNPEVKLEVVGYTRTKVLEITGGFDLAEPIPVTDAEHLEPGSVVIIDEQNPGHVRVSTRAYDRRVAGIVSGAGGINPGVTLRQTGVMEGNQNIALTGRVYAKATAGNGQIKPGDLLTTSNLTGHLMKAANYRRQGGAIVGKAMSTLSQGTGLVLVLVNLQ